MATIGGGHGEGLSVTRRHAEHVASIADGVDADAIVGRPLNELREIVDTHLIPTLFWFRKVCGRVVKRDPVTGELQGVPNATVYVEDTDAGLLWYFPRDWDWGWYLPLWRRREVIATAVTDECGYWCALVPRWDIDRVVRWRRERRCFLDIGPLRVRDVIDKVVPLPGPGPDPEPYHLREARTAIANAVGEPIAKALAAPPAEFGAPETTDAVLDQRAYPRRLQPPMLDDSVTERIEELRPVFEEAAAGRGVELRKLDWWRWHGPFVRCHDVLVPEVTTVFDVPDITFRVTQDVDGDGDQDTIYDEGPFDVRWNAGDLGDVILEARPNAVASVTCDQPPIQCGNEPVIEAIGLMPAQAPYLDIAAGYGKRTNRPSASGITAPPHVAGDSAFSPFAGTLPIWGCPDVAGAEHYRILYRLDGGPEREMVVPDWTVARQGGGTPVTMHCDADGWFRIADLNQCVTDHLVLYWHTPHWTNGAYSLRLELSDGAKNPLGGAARYSDSVAVRTDNTRPLCGFTVKARLEGDSTPWSAISPLPAICPVVERPPGKAVELRVEWTASAMHLRSVRCSAYGCGAGGVSTPAGADPADYQHWYTTAADNTVSRTSMFEIAAGAPNGAYHVGFEVVSRAFNPAGDNNAAALGWFYDPSYIYITPEMVIAVYTV